MAETSFLWTTDDTPVGHQVTGVTEAHWNTVLKVLGGCKYSEGVSDYSNKLAGTVTGANTVEIDAGGALVDGKAYRNSDPLSVNVPNASTGTRIDRIVLRKDASVPEVVIHRIEGTAGASPVAPSITRSGDIYDLKLYQAEVDTSGNVTLTDEREWADLDVDGVTLENIAGVLEVKDAGIDPAKLSYPYDRYYHKVVASGISLEVIIIP